MKTLTVIETKERRTASDDGREILVKYESGHYTISQVTTIIDTMPNKPLIWYNISHDNTEYLPDIYAIESNLKTSDFEVQTTAYGTLKAEDISKVIAGFQEAQELALTLRKMFVEEA